nr:LEAF RUST 10 DISEASE-RESISTANCE LOCUS RECEPTOR-LIKE PROTEIN KINASE-like 2.7 [Ipomoea batatas]
MASPLSFIAIFLFFSPFLQLGKSEENVCRKWCGDIPIQYPLGIDDGCGSPYYRHIITCTAGELQLRTPSGRYPIKNVSYSDPHILVTDPFMWTCDDGEDFRPTRPFSLDTSTHFTLSPQNDYLFFNCSPDKVIVEPKPAFCERFPEQCDSTCDSASFLCRHLPECPSALRGGSTCCAYYPKAAESLRLMLRHCASYTGVYWRNLGATPAFNQVPEYGVRVDFDIPVTGKCLGCQDVAKGGGTCGFDTETQDFLCLCDKGNSTTNCFDTRHKMSKVVAATAVSVAGAIGIGAGVWYLRRVRAKAPVTHGVQTNDNRLF